MYFDFGGVVPESSRLCDNGFEDGQIGEVFR